MSAIQKLNQFAQTPMLGSPDLAFNYNTKSALINPSSVATKLQVGQGVKLIAGASPTILVDQAAANEKAFGVIVYQLKRNTYSAGQPVEVACKGNVLYLEASAAISRGAAVELVPAGPTVVTKNTGNQLGIALDQASAAGDLIRVEIDPA